MVDLGVGLWLFLNFCVSAGFFLVDPVVAYVDADGDSLLCVYNAGPHEFYGRWVFSVKSGRSVEVSLASLVVGLSASGACCGPFTSGTSPALILTTGGGSSYAIYPVAVLDTSSVSCGSPPRPLWIASRRCIGAGSFRISVLLARSFCCSTR